MPFPRGVLVVFVALAVSVGACGDSGSGGRATPTTPPVGTNPTASAPDAHAPPPDATQPGTGPVTSPTTEQNAVRVRVPATFVVRGGKLDPPTITVPPFLAVELSLVSADGNPHRLVLRTPALHALSVGPGERAAVQIAGLRAGRYAVVLDGRVAGALVAGGEVGP